MNIAAIAIIVTLLIMLTVLWRLWQRSVRADYIRTYTFPPALYEKLRQRRPELALKDCQLVGRALRQFFLAYMQGGCRYVSMPSQVTDDLWHELILYTRHYQLFCKKARRLFAPHACRGIEQRQTEQYRLAAHLVVKLPRGQHQSVQTQPAAAAFRHRSQTQYRRRFCL